MNTDDEPNDTDSGAFLAVDEVGTMRSVVVEDNGRTVYAYLLHGDEIVGDVWLLNSVETPEEPEWNDKALMPFRNPREYCVAESVRPLDPGSILTCIWFDKGALVFIDGQLTARIEAGSFPGWSVNASKDGPLAGRLDTSR